MRRAFCIAFFCVFSAVLLADSTDVALAKNKQQILVIHSYQDNLRWSRELTRGIETCLSDNKVDAEIFTVHLDAKRILSKQRHLERLRVALDDYQFEGLNLIITCDDDALNALLDLRHPLSENIPIVFCGVENLTAEMLIAYPNLTGVTQSFDFLNTFKTAAKLFPQAKEVVIVTENSLSGSLARKNAEEQLGGLSKSMTVEYIDGTQGVTTEMLLEKMKNMSKDAVVLMSTWANGYDGEYLREKDAVTLFSENCPAPIFTVDEMNISEGAIGGYVMRGFEQAYLATSIGIGILQGSKVASFPVQQIVIGKPIFDWDQMQRWKVKESLLPKDSTIIDKPLNFFEVYKLQISIAITIFIFTLLLLVFVTWYHLKYRARIKEKEAEVSKAQKNLAEQRNELLTTLRSIGEGVISVNNNKEIISINPLALSYLGLEGDATEYIGKNINNYLHITCSRKDCTLNKMIDQTLVSEESTSLHENAILVPLNSEKDTIYIAGNISKMVNEGELYGTVIVFRDVTAEHKHKQELIHARNKALESDKLKSAFLANMSHEIRTPLNGIVGFANLLTEGDYSEEEKAQFIHIINSNCQVLLGLISDILDLSRIESGTLSFRMDECNINMLVKDVADTVQVNMPAGVKLVKEIPEKDIVMITDNLRLTQVITNLINNAIKFTKEGSVTVGYELVENNEKIRFFVRDTGCGIAKEDLKNIFGRFFKKDEFAQGVGLGLAICEAIVERFGGTISVDSNLGEGTVFDIVIPYLKSSRYVAPEEAEAAVAKQNNSRTSDKDFVVLVAEDDNSNYRLIDAVLSKNYTLIRARNGVEAVDLFKNHPVDVILMDVKMPIMTGLEALLEIRKISPDVPVIMQTAYAFDSDKEEAQRAGCNDFITKPIQIEVLKSVMKKYLVAVK